MTTQLIITPDAIRELIKEAAIKTDVLSVEEASIVTKLSVRSIYKLVEERQIPFYKRDNMKRGGTYFSKTELEQWCLAKKYPTKEESFKIHESLLTQ